MKKGSVPAAKRRYMLYMEHADAQSKLSITEKGMQKIILNDVEREELGLALDARTAVLVALHTKLMKERQLEAAALIKSRIDVMLALKNKVSE